MFFKLCLVGYLENIPSDRKLIEVWSMRLDILFFLGYKPLPWHSTMNRTRQLFPKSLFKQVFTQVVGMCVDTPATKHITAQQPQMHASALNRAKPVSWINTVKIP